MKKRIIALLLILAIIAPLAAQKREPAKKLPPKKKNEVVNKTDTTEVNWTTQYVTAIGWSIIDKKRWKNETQAELMAIRGAEVVAQRNLLETLKGVRITADTHVVDLITQSDNIKTELEGVLRGAEMVGEPVIDSKRGFVEVTMRAPLYQDKYGIAGVIQRNMNINPMQADPNGSGVAFRVEGDADPAMFPTILGPNGEVIETSKMYNPDEGNFPNLQNLTEEELIKYAKEKGVSVVDLMFDKASGNLKVKETTDNVSKWGKIGKTLLNIGKFAMFLL